MLTGAKGNQQGQDFPLNKPPKKTGKSLLKRSAANSNQSRTIIIKVNRNM